MSESVELVTDFSEVDKQEFRIQNESFQEKLAEEDLILSAYVSRNDDVLPRTLDLHVEKGSTIADVTYGKGNFWTNVNLNDYEVYASDLDPGKSPSGYPVDCRDLPYEDNSLDAIVLDPPYREGFFRQNKDMLATGDEEHDRFRKAYSNGEVLDTKGSKYHQAVLDLYWEAGIEAHRVLKEDGTLIVKTQDEVSSNTQELTHIQITNFYEKELDLYTKDLFVVVRLGKPAVSGMNNQVHARKNHSYFLVYEMNTNDPVNVLYDD
ncbi:DNA methyltransferase [Halorubrum sp. ARQ200]|uniref:DNA methyltransferase n=1 Tax=Halorubrum sp. ARQ200 TaxID=1855872 RepID=UPI0010F8D821|nr:DNA methyltransferase [Halorubrum sp. ARQ200]TKX45168.1 site-specific DNA-methyltransferase [Halorubrum sp. ARQ200]